MTELQAEAVDANLPIAPKVKGVSIGVAEPDALLLLGGHAKDAAFAKAVKSALRVDLPSPGEQAGKQRLLIWQGYGRWLVYCHSSGAAAFAALNKAMGEEAPISDVTDGYVALAIEGEKLRDLLAIGSSTDCSAEALPVGSTAVLRFAELPASLIVTGRDKVLLLVERASKDYVWTWLCRAVGLLS
ncbi:MAG: sarcosine oxidase subunit gamma family protein [Kiloniellales bacterium]